MSSGTCVQTTRWASATAIYGLVSVAVVIVAWESDQGRWDLTLLIVGYLAVLWLTHSYARVVSAGPGGSWRQALSSELPVAVGGIPVLVVAVLGALVELDDEAMSTVAL